MSPLRTCAFGLALAGVLAGVGSVAGTSAGFDIHVRVYTPAAGEQVCTSEARGDRRNAIVRVLCTVGPFVTIAPMPGQQTAVHTSEPTRREVRPDAPMVRSAGFTASFDPRVTVGTLTSLQVSSASESGSAIEMLVSF